MKFSIPAIVAILFMLTGPVLAQTGNVYFPGCYQQYNTVYPATNSGHYGPYNYYNYSPGYAYQKVVAQEIAVAPYIVTVPVDSRQVPIQNYGVGHYWSVQESYQQKQLIRDAVREELRAVLGGQTAQPSTVPAQPATNPLTALANKVTDLGVDTTTPAEVSQPLIASMNQFCFKCHGAVDADIKGGLRLLIRGSDGTLKLAKQTDDRKWRIFGEMSTGLMPPASQQDTSKAVPQNQQLAWYKWASGR